MDRQVVEFLNLPLELQFQTLNNVDLSSYINFASCSQESHKIAKVQTPFYIKENYQYHILKLQGSSLTEYYNYPLLKKLFDEIIRFEGEDFNNYEVEIKGYFHKDTTEKTTDFLLLGPWTVTLKPSYSTHIYYKFDGTMINHQINGILRYFFFNEDDQIYIMKDGLRQKHIAECLNYIDISFFDDKGRITKTYVYRNQVSRTNDNNITTIFGSELRSAEDINLTIEKILDNEIPNLQISSVARYDYITCMYEKCTLRDDGYWFVSKQIRWKTTDKPGFYLYKYKDKTMELSSNVEVEVENIWY